MNGKQKLILIGGPTASGKTSLSIRLAKALNGEIISADSMQVYRRMDIGTAKVTKEEMEGVPHHLIDILEPDEEWNVMTFKARAEQAIQEIAGRGHLPVICGGTGFYVDALLYDTRFEDEPGQREIRQRLERRMAEEGPRILHEELRLVDPVSAEKIHYNNEKRVIRALEFFELHQEPISAHNEAMKKRESPYDFLYFAIDMDRQVLYDRIDQRVDRMIEDGLVEEVERLVREGVRPGMTSMQGLGYKEILPYLNGETTLEEAVRVLKRDTRHFAKRQLTWFRAEKPIIWLKAADPFAEAMSVIKKSCNAAVNQVK